MRRDHPGTQRPAARRTALRLALVLGSLFLAVHLLLPQVAGLEAVGERLAGGSWLLLGSVLVLEAASLAAYAELVRAVLTTGGTPVRRWLVQRVVMIGTSLGKTLPGGSPAATAATVRILADQKVPPGAALAGLAAAGVLSSAVLGLLLVPASVSAVLTGQGGGYLLAATGAAMLVVGVAAGVPAAVRNPERAGDWVRRGARPLARGPMGRWVDPERLATEMVTGLSSLRRLVAERRSLAVVSGWALANWLADLCVLLLLADAFGVGPALLSVPLVYVVGQLTAALPLTPGGVGVVETVMIGALTAAGSPAAAATAAVLGWRLVSHWLPILAGAALLPSLLSRSG